MREPTKLPPSSPPPHLYDVSHSFCLLSRCIWILGLLHWIVGYHMCLWFLKNSDVPRLGYLRGFGYPISRQLYPNLPSPFLSLYLAPVVFLYRLIPRFFVDLTSQIEWKVVVRCATKDLCSLVREKNHSCLQYSFGFFFLLPMLFTWILRTTFCHSVICTKAEFSFTSWVSTAQVLHSQSKTSTSQKVLHSFRASVLEGP